LLRPGTAWGNGPVRVKMLRTYTTVKSC